MKDNYKILDVIATGGMATIYKAEQKSLSRPVIIKKLHPHLATDTGLVKRFEREAQTLGKLNHKNIVEIIDFFKSKGDYFIVLEFVEGKSLKHLIKETKSLPENIANYILIQVAMGLQIAHKKGVLHRDIKPANILLGIDGKVKISDFGLALTLETTEITDPGATIGTPAYLAPELLKGKRATPRSDIYSLGLTYYETLTGKNPFQANNKFETMNNILYKKVPTLKIANTEQNKTISRIISKMTQQEPEDRYATVNAVILELKSLSTINQKQLAEFLLNPFQTKHVKEVKQRTSRGYIVYFSLLIFTILVTLAMHITAKRLRYLNSKFDYPHINNSHNYVHTDSSLTTIIKPLTEMNSTKTLNKDNSETLNTNQVNIMLKPDSYGFLKPLIKPWANIFVDNLPYGTTPLSKPIKLISGNHLLTLKHPNREQLTRTITIAESETLSLSIALQETFGFLKISVKPWATVYIDGENIGITPVAKPFHISSGEHSLELEKDGLILWHEKISIPLGDTLKKTINLEK